MRDPWSPVKTPAQPPLFAPQALAVTLQLLVDHTDETAVWGVQTVDPIDGHLVALWASSPMPLDQVDQGMRAAHQEFLTQTRDATGPFPPRLAEFRCNLSGCPSSVPKSF
jgi:hypothetical protein